MEAECADKRETHDSEQNLKMKHRTVFLRSKIVALGCDLKKERQPGEVETERCTTPMWKNINVQDQTCSER